MTIINSLKDLVKTTIRKVLITATLMITDFINEDSQNNNEDLHVIESSRETLHSDDNQNQKHPSRNRPVNRK